MRRRATLALLVGAAVMIPAAVHVGLAMLIHNRIAAIAEKPGSPVTFQHDGVNVGPFAYTVRVDNPRFGVPHRKQPILTAAALRLERASSLVGWLWDGRFDVTARLLDMDQDTAWLRRQGAGDEQQAVIDMLGLDDGTGKARLRLAFDPDRQRFTSAFHYGTRGNEATFAALTAVAEEVDADTLAALTAMRMPDIDSARVTTRYSGKPIRRAVADLGEHTRLSEATLLRLLAVPLPHDWVVERLARAQVDVERVHLEPLLSGLRIDHFTRPARRDADAWQGERLRLGGLHLASSDGGLMVRGLRLEGRGLTVPTAALRQEVRAPLRAAGYDDPSLDFQVTYRHDPKTEALRVAPLTIEADGMGDLEAELELTEVDPARLTRRPVQALIGSAFRALSLHYTDRGLVRRLKATLSNRPSEAEALSRRLRDWLQATTGDRAPELTAATEHFLDDPGRLTLRARPQSPVPIRVLVGLAAMGRYAAISERLRLGAEAESRPN